MKCLAIVPAYNEEKSIYKVVKEIKKLNVCDVVVINDGSRDNTYIQGEVIIGNDVMMAPNVAIIAVNHNYDRIDIPMNKQGKKEKPINICDDVWLGYGSKILSGVTVNKGAIVGAGSVVTKDVPEYSIVGGNPARVIKMRRV